MIHIDEGKAPLAQGQQIIGKIVEVVQSSRPSADRDAVIEIAHDAPSPLHAYTIYARPRFTNETWMDFKAGKPIGVNLNLLDLGKKERARGIGTLRLVK